MARAKRGRNKGASGGSSGSPPLKATKTSSSSSSGNAVISSTRVVALIVSHLLQLQQDPDTAAALDRLAAGDSTVLSCCQPQDDAAATTTTNTSSAAPLDTTTTGDDTAGYWILWATHVLEDLGSAAEFVVSSSSADKDDIAAALAWLAWSLAPLVRTNSVVRILAHAPGRHVLGRAALATAAAAARALTHWNNNHGTNATAEDDDDASATRRSMALLAAILALDQMVLPFQDDTNSTSTSTSNNSTLSMTQQTSQLWDKQARTSLDQALRTYWQQQQQDDDDKHSKSSNKNNNDKSSGWIEPDLYWSEEEEACLEALLEMTNTCMAAAVSDSATSEPPPLATRSSTARRGTTAARRMALTPKEVPLATLFRRVIPVYKMDDAFNNSTSSSMTRWVTMALTSSSQAHRMLLLETALLIVQPRPDDGAEEQVSWVAPWHCSLVVSSVSAEAPAAAAAATVDMDEDQKMPAAVTTSTTTTTTTRTTSKKRKPTTSTNNDDNDGDDDGVLWLPSAVAAVTVASRLIRILREICANHNGSGMDRTFTGGLKLYMQTCWSPLPVTTKSTKKSSKSSPAAAATTDVRDVTTVLMYHLLNRHFECLCSYAQDTSLSVVNDSEHPADEPLVAYYPFLPDTFGLLFQHASTSLGTLPYDEQAQVRQRLECLAAAFVLQQYQHHPSSRILSSGGDNKTTCPLDARLVMFATTHVAGALNEREEHLNVLNQKTGLPVPTMPPTPSASTTKRSNKRTQTNNSSSKTTHCSYAGLFPEEYEHVKSRSELRGDGRLAMFLRAMPSTTDWNHRITALVSWLIDLVDALYDTRCMEYPTVVAAAAVAATTSSSSEPPPALDSGSKNKSSGRTAKKQKKTASPDTSQTNPEEGLPFRKITSTRALVASESLESLVLCLRHSYSDLPSFTAIQNLLRDAVSIEHMNRLVDLEEKLSKIFTRAPGSAGGSPYIGAFSTQERKLWISHMNMCVCLGRGRVSYRNGDRHRLLNKKRLGLFKRISSNTLPSSGTGKRWPLWLPPAHKMFVAANVGTEDRLSLKDSEADRYIVDGAIASLSDMLQEISAFPRVETTAEVVNMYDPVHMSLDDTRIILTALTYLPEEVRATSFASLVGIVRAWFDQLNSRPDDLARIREDAEVSGFVARAVTLCANAYSLLRFGPLLRRELKEVLSAALTPQQLCMRKRPDYSSEKSFASVLEDWQFADYITHVRFSLQDVDKASEVQLQSLLESAFGLGFSTASKDQCHFLFASWNALGKCEMWSPIKSVSPLPKEIRGQVPSIILDLRNDLCYVHRLVSRATARDFSKSSLSFAIESRETRNSQQTKSEWALLAREGLCAMVKKACTLGKRATSELFVDGEPVSCEVFCLLELLPTYVSFAVSMLTRPNANFFSCIYDQFVDQSSKRGRGYSTESEVSVAEDSHESQDYQVSAYERLQDVCETLGAVPDHPDWIDKECTLLEGVSYAKAVEVAQKAQSCVTDLLAIAARQSKLHAARALEVGCSESPQHMGLATSLAVHLCWLVFPMIEASFDGPSDDDEEQSVLSDIGKVCLVDASVFDALNQECGERRDMSRRQLCKTAAQRVQGRLHDLFRSGPTANYASGPELRAAEEWEILLARSLSSANTSGTDRSKLSEASIGYAVQADRWQVVLWNAVENLSPITALLRFGLSRGGRDTHPLSSNDFSVDDFDSSHSSLQSDLPSGTVFSASIKRSVLETLGILCFVLPDDLASSAAAIHLLPDMNTYTTLQSIGICRSAVTALERINSLLLLRPHSERQTGIVERLASLIKRCGSIDCEEDISAAHQKLLLAAFESKEIDGAKTIVTPDLNLSRFWSALRLSKVLQIPGVYMEENGHERLLRGLVPYVWHDGVLASERARVLLGNALCCLLWHEYDRTQRPCLLVLCNLVNDTKDSSLVSILQTDIGGDSIAVKGTYDSPLRDIRSVMCTLLSLVLSISTFTKSDVVVKTLLGCLPAWGGVEWTNRLSILNLLFLHASVTGELDLVGDRLVASLGNEDECIESFAYFCSFVAGLQSALSVGNDHPKDKETITGQAIPSLCSYAKLADFREQHWYQCYTCDLTGDRGCCTLCALACHRDHDVVYARHSSFFCDCGAERSDSDQSRPIHCQCLSPKSPSEIDSILQGWQKVGASARSDAGMRPPDLRWCTGLLVMWHQQESKSAIQAFHSVARPSEWGSLAFKYIASELSQWKASDKVSSRIPSNYLGSLRSRLSLHPRTAPCVEVSLASPFRPLRSFHDGTLRTLSAVKRSYLKERGVSRHALDADGRGRLAVADADSVLFCNGLSHISTEVEESYLARSSLCILNSFPVYFEIIGVQFSKTLERMVAVWGSNRVTVLEMSSNFSCCERRLDLGVDLKTQAGSSDTIIQCHWLKDACLAVMCRRTLFVYHLDQSEKEPHATIRLQDSDSEFMDFIAFRLSDPLSRMWKIFILLKDGSLHGTSISDSTPVGSKALLLAGQGLHIAAAPAAEGSSEQENYVQGGTKLSFLEQSRILVYQGEKHVYGLPVGADGIISRAFVLVDQPLACPGGTADVSRGGISGPYTQWRDAGLVQYDDDTLFFRASCVGEHDVNGQPVLLLIDFNELETKALKVWWDPGSQDGGPFHGRFHIDGCAVFSAPVLRKGNSSGIEQQFPAEKAFIAFITSKGSFHVFAEKLESPSRSSVEPFVCARGEVQKGIEPSVEPQIPLLAFESLTNVTDSTEIFFKDSGGESSDQIKTKLARDNDLSLRSPDCDGFTLNIAIKAAGNTNARPSMAVTAVRLLFGSSCLQGIPKFVTVQGRRYPLLADTKRWYAFHLTSQDVLLGIRSGVISIRISQSYDGSTKPIIDALETYAMERTEIDRWLPTSVRTAIANNGPKRQTSDLSSEIAAGSARFRLVLKAMTSLNLLLGHRRPSEKQTSLLQELVQVTALHYDRDLADAVGSLVSSFGSSIDDPQEFLDHATISCCAHFLMECGRALESFKSIGGREDCSLCWQGLRPQFRACLRVSAGVARLRPNNYLKAIADHSQSVAVRASMLMDSFFVQSPLNVDAVSDFVELSLLESAVARGYGADYDTRGRFAGFDILHRLLASPNGLIVKRTCTAISSFCERYSLVERLGSDEVDLFAAKPLVVHYECDGCGLFPIVNERYCLDDEDRPLDLCVDCYRLARDFATAKNFDDSQDLIIRGRTLGEASRLTCAEVLSMEALPIRKSTASDSGDNLSEKRRDENNSASEKQSSSIVSNQAEVFQRQQLFDEFMDGLFSTLVNLFSRELEKQELFVSALLSLVFELTLHSDSSDHKTDRASRLARKLVEGLSRLMQRYHSVNVDAEANRRKLEICIARYLVALSTLVVPDDSAREYVINPSNESSMPLEETADSSRRSTAKCWHGIPAVRRVFTNESNSGRVFYCCGTKSRAHRCNFFTWSNGDHPDSKSLFNESIANLIWDFMSRPQSKDTQPLCTSICNLVKKSMDRTNLFSSQFPDPIADFLVDQRQKSANQVLVDFADGVWCSKERLSTVRIPGSITQAPLTTDTGRLSLERDVLCAAFELMALAAGSEASCGISNWFSPLCLVLLSESENMKSFRSKAKRALWQLCGKTPEMFLAVRDSYLFKIQFEEVLKGTQCLRDYCLIVNSKAEQHIRQRRSDSATPTNPVLHLRDIVGASDLMNEDISLKDYGAIVEKALDELLSIATKRSYNWRKFCFSKGEHEEDLQQKPAPIDALLAVTCLLSGELQIKAMELANLGVTPGSIIPTALDDQPSSLVSADRKEDAVTPQLVSFQESRLSCDDLYAFVVRFVCGDESQEIRKLAVKVASGLCDKERHASELIARLMKKPLALVGSMGKLSFDFLVLMNELINIAKPASVDVESLASTISLLFQKQTIAACYDRSNGESFHFETRSSASVQKTRFELARCAHVVLRHSPSSSRPANKMKRLPEQVSPFTRIHLEMGRNTSSSNEFNSFIVLSYRCVLSEIHVEVCDPRGRYVKKINFYTSPRPVKSPGRLKAAEYDNKWQLCGTLDLPRGAEKATCTLERPVVASNLRIEYAEFFDRPGSPKSGDGFVVHCPRCTRIVTNAHGVCASCGEVAFQCRRCRHINYDRLDAFLCVECGFCASGSFSYDITSGIASNAIAITNDHDYRQAAHMYSAASWLFEEIQSVLRQKLMQLSDCGKRAELSIVCSDSVKRAFEGKIPLLPDGKEVPNDPAQSLLKRFNKRGSIVKAVARKGGSRSSSSSQSRPGSTSTIRIIRSHRGGENSTALEDDDDEVLASDLLGGLLERAGMPRDSLDPSDPVSRFLASVHNRARERRTIREGGGSQDPPSEKIDDSGTTAPASKSKTFEECERLYRLMHEAQRECFALGRRLDAWRRLESGSLCYSLADADSVAAFEPSHCSICSGVVAHQLLVLWQSLFHLDPGIVVVSKDLLAILLNDEASSSSSSRALQESKLAAVKDIALQSEKYRPLVLEALRSRLGSFGDMHCADILGRIMKEGTDASVLEPFVALARETLESNPIM